MRPRMTLILLVTALGGCALAQTQTPAATNGASTDSYVVYAPPARTFTLSSPVASGDSSGNGIVQKNRVFRAPEWQGGVPFEAGRAATQRWFRLPDVIFADAGCFKMRSYVMRRESAGSDVTVPAGYTECTPAARVKMKNAVPEAQDEEEEK